MNLNARCLLLLASVLSVSACHWGSAKAPTGQVVATVGDREITLRQVHMELSGASPTTAAAQKVQQRAALDHILQRSILADAAKQQGLDKDPDFILLSQRANDALLVQLLQRKIAAGVPPPTNEEATHFEEANPNIFAERKIFDVEQIRMAPPADSSLLAKLRPLNTLDEIAGFLTQNHVVFRRGTSTIDALGQNPKLVTTILALPPQEVFIISAGNAVLINHITNTRTEPFTGPQATKYALYALRGQHTQEAVQKAFGAFLTKARGNVRLAKEYQAPTKPAASPKPAKPSGS